MLKRIVSIFLTLPMIVAGLSFISLPKAQAITVTPSGACSATYTTVAGSPDVRILENIVNGNTYCILVFKSSNENSSAVVSWTAPSGINSFHSLLIGGGGSGGAGRGGGGGAGEMWETEIPANSPNFTLTVGKGGNGVSNGQGVTGDSTTISSSYITRQVRGGGGGGSHSGTASVNVERGQSGGSGGGSGMNYSINTFNYSFSGGDVATLGTGLGNAGGGAYQCSTTAIHDKIRVTGGGGGAGSAGTSGGFCPDSNALFSTNFCTQNSCYGAVSPSGGSGRASNLLSGLNASFGYTNNLFSAGGGGAIGLGTTEYCGTGSGQTGTYCSFPSGFSSGDRSTGGAGGSTGLGGSGAGVTGDGIAGTATTGSGGGGSATGTSGRGGSGVIAIKYLLPKTSLSAPTVPTSTSQQAATFTSNVTNPSNLNRTKQWEVSADGNNWSSVTGGTGATSDTYTTSTLSVLSNSGKYYRLKFTDTSTVENVNGGTSTLSTTSYTSAALLTVNKASQAAFSLTSTSGTYLTDLKLTTSGGSDTGAVSFSLTSSNPANCSITNVDSLTSSSAGTCQVVATKAGTSEFLPAYDTQTITLGKATLQLTMSVAGSSTIKYGSTATSTFTTNRSLGTGNIETRTGTISYSASGLACSINSSTGSITMNRASGTCTVQVSLANDSNYLDTSSALVTLTAAKADTLTITSGNLSLTYNGDSQTPVNSYSISGLKFSDTVTALTYRYSGVSNSSITYSSTANTPVEAGSYTITPSAAGITNSDSYTAISYATGVLTVNRASRTLSGSAAATVKYGGQESVTVTTSPSSSADGTLSFTNGSSTACSVNSSTGRVTMNRAAGTCSIVPSISQGANYLTATGSAVAITPAKADAITVTAAAKTSIFTGSASAITPTYSVSGLQFSDTVTVTYGYMGLSNGGNIYSFVADKPSLAGSYSIIPIVSQANSDSYTASATINSGALTITRAARTLSPSTYSKSTLKYGESATVTSNTTSPSTNNDGEFLYSVGSGCSIDSGSGTVTAANYQGTCSSTTTIQQGNNYESATATAVSFSLSKADTITVTASSPSAVTYTGSAAAVTPTVSVSGLVAGDSATGATFSYSRAPSCAAGGTCQVGDIGPGGGKVFYASGTAINSSPGISGGGIYLEIAPTSFSKTTYTWCEGPGNPNTTLFGATATTIGSGAANTKIMIDNCSGGAGVQAANLTLGGKSDWFLPSYNELVEIYNQRAMLGLGTGKYASTYLYWSSTEAENWIASSLVPWAGVGGQNKADATPYLPIRAFSPTSTTYESPTSSPTNAGTYRITPSALTLSGGITTSYYVATVYETGTLTINKAAQAAFTNYSTLSGVFGITLPIVKFGGSGDGAESIETTNGSATGCAFSGTLLTATAAGTCSVSATKDLSENYLQYDSVFSVNFEYYVPAPAPPVSTTPTQIAVEAKNNWSVNASVGPTITGISPSSGPVGTVVTITGTGMNGVDVIKIGRRNLTSVTGVSETSVTGVIPAGATSGPIFVSNSLGSHFFPSGFTVTP